MRNNLTWNVKRQVLTLFSAVAALWLLGNSSTNAQDLTWSATAADTANNWATATNWTILTEVATAPPTATESASVNGTAGAVTPAANIAGVAFANQLLVGATIGEGGVAAAPPNDVNIGGTGASLTLSGTELPAGQVSLDVVNGSITVANGGALVSSGSQVGAIAGATEAEVTVTGAGSTWTEHDTLDIGAGNSAIVTVADAASFRSGQPVTVEALGELQIGDGGLAGTFNAPAIVNNDLILGNFTDTTTLAAQISGTGSVEMEGGGTLTLSGNNSYAGDTTIFDGTVIAAATNALGASFVDITGAASVLQINPGTSQTNIVNLRGGATLNNFGALSAPPTDEGSTVTVFGDGFVNNGFAASITNTTGVAILGDVAGGGEGAASISGRGLGTAAAIPDPVIVTNAGTVSGTVGIQLIDGVDGSITNASTGVVTGTSGTAIDASLGGTVTLSNAGVIRGDVILAAFRNMVTLFTGSRIAGNLNLGDAAAAGLILDGTGAASLTQAVTGAVTNFNSLIKQNSGTWTIDEALTYAGGTSVNGGTLVAAASNALGTGLVTVSNTGLLRVGAGVTVPNFIQLNNGGNLTNDGTVQVNAAGAASNAAVTTAGGGSVTNDEGATISGLGLIGIQGLPGSATITNAGAVSGTEAIDLVGGGTVTNNATGRVTGSGGLAVAIGGSQALLSNAGLINGNVELNALTNTAQLFTGEKIAGNLTLSPSGANEVILDGVGTATISQAVTGTITNAGSLTKQGSGTWIIDRPTSAAAAVNVDLGTLQVDSKLAAAVVNVQQSATLKGTGVISLATGGTVYLAGVLAPGDSPGILTINGNYTQTSTGTYNVLILSPTDYSQLLVTGHATLAGTLKLTLGSGYVPAPGTQFAILRAAGGISGQFQNFVGPQGQVYRVTYNNGSVDLIAGPPKKVVPTEYNLSDGTPSSTTALMANSMFYDFRPLSESMAESGNKDNTIAVSFDAGTFTFQGHHGEEYGFPITGGFKINDRARLDYQIPLEYVEIANTGLFEAGLTLELPMNVVIATPDQHFSWDLTPAAAVAAAGSREVIGAGALTNVFAYRFPAFTLTYGNYISFFEGDTLSDDDQQFPIGVDQRILKNGLKVTIPFGKGWVVECYGIYTEFLRTAPVSSYVTAGFELGRHFVWNVEGKDVDLGYLSFGLYTEQGNRYSAGHFRVGSAWRF